MSVPVIDLLFAGCHLIGGQWVDSSLLRRTIPRQLSPKLTFALAETTAGGRHGLHERQRYAHCGPETSRGDFPLTLSCHADFKKEAASRAASEESMFWSILRRVPDG